VEACPGGMRGPQHEVPRAPACRPAPLVGPSATRSSGWEAEAPSPLPCARARRARGVSRQGAAPQPACVHLEAGRAAAARACAGHNICNPNAACAAALEARRARRTERVCCTQSRRVRAAGIRPFGQLAALCVRATQGVRAHLPHTQHTQSSFALTDEWV